MNFAFNFDFVKYIALSLHWPMLNVNRFSEVSLSAAMHLAAWLWIACLQVQEKSLKFVYIPAFSIWKKAFSSLCSIHVQFTGVHLWELKNTQTL